MRDLHFGSILGAPDFWKLPHGIRQEAGNLDGPSLSQVFFLSPLTWLWLAKFFWAHAARCFNQSCFPASVGRSKFHRKVEVPSLVEVLSEVPSTPSVKAPSCSYEVPEGLCHIIPYHIHPIPLSLVTLVA